LVTPGATRGTRDVSNPQQADLPAVWQVVVSTCNKPVCCGKIESEKDSHLISFKRAGLFQVVLNIRFTLPAYPFSTFNMVGVREHIYRLHFGNFILFCDPPSRLERLGG